MNAIEPKLAETLALTREPLPPPRRTGSQGRARMCGCRCARCAWPIGRTRPCTTLRVRIGSGGDNRRAAGLPDVGAVDCQSGRRGVLRRALRLALDDGATSRRWMSASRGCVATRWRCGRARPMPSLATRSRKCTTRGAALVTPEWAFVALRENGRREWMAEVLWPTPRASVVWRATRWAQRLSARTDHAGVRAAGSRARTGHSGQHQSSGRVLEPMAIAISW